MSGISLPAITDVGNLQGKRVIVRASLDVPLKDGIITNGFRVQRALPTLSFLVGKGARVILLTHIGRNPETTLDPLISVLRDALPLTYVRALEGDVVNEALRTQENGTVVLLENLRSQKGEEENDKAFAALLASYGDMYVNDAFAVSHRAHASIVGIPEHIPSFAGITFLEEYEALGRVGEPLPPSLFILGGAKFETKEPLIERYAETYSTVFIGGALANDFLKAKGFQVGKSLLSSVDLGTHALMQRGNILLPIDVVVQGESGMRTTVPADVKEDEHIFDIGPETIKLLAPHIASAKNILWNGPLGYYEGGFDVATKACAALVAASEAHSVIGGGDTVATIESLNLTSSFDFISTAGGAMLTFLEKGTLPGIEALIRK